MKWNGMRFTFRWLHVQFWCFMEYSGMSIFSSLLASFWRFSQRWFWYTLWYEESSRTCDVRGNCVDILRRLIVLRATVAREKINSNMSTRLDGHVSCFHNYFNFDKKIFPIATKIWLCCQNIYSNWGLISIFSLYHTRNRCIFDICVHVEQETETTSPTIHNKHISVKRFLVSKVKLMIKLIFLTSNLNST